MDLAGDGGTGASSRPPPVHHDLCSQEVNPPWLCSCSLPVVYKIFGWFGGGRAALLASLSAWSRGCRMGAGYLGQRDNAASSHGGALKHHQPLRGKTRAEAVPWPPSFANWGTEEVTLPRVRGPHPGPPPQSPAVPGGSLPPPAEGVFRGMAGSPGPAALSTETHFPAFILPENLKTRLHPEGPGSKSGDTNLRVSRASDDFHRSVPDCGAGGTGVEQSRVPAPPPSPAPHWLLQPTPVSLLQRILQILCASVGFLLLPLFFFFFLNACFVNVQRQ